MSNLFLINVLLAVAWCAVMGSFTMLNLLFGFSLASIALWLIREQHGTSKYFRRGWLLIDLMFLFLKELVLSALRVAKLVLTPGQPYRPGFFAFPLRVTENAEITLLANLITLTPGTLSVDVSNDKKTLYIHCVDVDDIAALRDDIAQGFEKKIMEALR